MWETTMELTHNFFWDYNELFLDILNLYLPKLRGFHIKIQGFFHPACSQHPYHKRPEMLTPLKT